VRLVEVIGFKPFDDTTTDLPMYDNWFENPEYALEQKGYEVNRVYITPDQYIEACVDGFNSSYESIMSTRKEKAAEYARLMKDGETFPMLTLVYSLGGHFTQEGLHRALAAKMIGIEKVPVLVVKEQP
jgi:hypothetical protein